MKRRVLRICHAIIRFDNIPPDVTSDVLSRTVLPGFGDILECEYVFSRNITIERLERKIMKDIGSKIGKEIRRLCSIGHAPVLHVGFHSSDLPCIGFSMVNRFMYKLVQNRRGIVIGFPSPFKGDELIAAFSPDFIRMLYNYKFSLEVV